MSKRNDPPYKLPPYFEKNRKRSGSAGMASDRRLRSEPPTVSLPPGTTLTKASLRSFKSPSTLTPPPLPANQTAAPARVNAKAKTKAVAPSTSGPAPPSATAAPPPARVAPTVPNVSLPSPVAPANGGTAPSSATAALPPASVAPTLSNLTPQTPSAMTTHGSNAAPLTAASPPTRVAPNVPVAFLQSPVAPSKSALSPSTATAAPPPAPISRTRPNTSLQDPVTPTGNGSNPPTETAAPSSPRSTQQLVAMPSPHAPSDLLNTGLQSPPAPAIPMTPANQETQQAAFSSHSTDSMFYDGPPSPPPPAAMAPLALIAQQSPPTSSPQAMMGSLIDRSPTPPNVKIPPQIGASEARGHRDCSESDTGLIESESDSESMEVSDLEYEMVIKNTSRFNTFSDAFNQMRSRIPRTKNADIMILQIRSGNFEFSIHNTDHGHNIRTIDPICYKESILEFNGHFQLDNEINWANKDSANILAYKFGQFIFAVNPCGPASAIRRSCEPSCYVQHLVGRNDIALMIRSLRATTAIVEITVPFNYYYRESKFPLRCAKHEKNVGDCPAEKLRIKYQLELEGVNANRGPSTSGSSSSKLNTFSDAFNQMRSRVPSTKDADLFIGKIRSEGYKFGIHQAHYGVSIHTMDHIQREQLMLEFNGYFLLDHEVNWASKDSANILTYKFEQFTFAVDPCGLTTAIRRSCEPSCRVEHFAENDIALLLRALETTTDPIEITVPFNYYYRESKFPLRCAKHEKNVDDCPAEKLRIKYQLELEGVNANRGPSTSGSLSSPNFEELCHGEESEQYERKRHHSEVDTRGLKTAKDSGVTYGVEVVPVAPKEIGSSPLPAAAAPSTSCPTQQLAAMTSPHASSVLLNTGLQSPPAPANPMMPVNQDSQQAASSSHSKYLIFDDEFDDAPPTPPPQAAIAVLVAPTENGSPPPPIAAAPPANQDSQQAASSPHSSDSIDNGPSSPLPQAAIAAPQPSPVAQESRTLLQSSFTPLAAALMDTFPESPYTTPYRALNYDESRRKAAPMKRRSDFLIVIATKRQVYKNDLIMEIFGDVTLPEEVEEATVLKNNDRMFKYPPHCHIHCEQREVFHFNIKFDGRFLRRSCTPNSTLVHYKTPEGPIRFFVRAMEDIPIKKEVTVEFNYDFRYSKIPLKCAYHRGREEKCKKEKHRKVVLKEIVGEE